MIAPEKSRDAVHPEGVFAVRLPSNSPPVSRGFDAPSNSPSTVPVVPLAMTKTPVTLYSFSVNAVTPMSGCLARACALTAGGEISSKNNVISDGTFGGGAGKAL